MLEKIVTQIELDLARDADQDPAHQKLEDALADSNSNQSQRVRNDLVLSDADIEIVNCASDDLREKNPDRVVEQQREAAPEKLDAVAIQIRLEGIESLEH